MRKKIMAASLLVTCVCTGCATQSEANNITNQAEESATETESVVLGDTYTLHGRYYLDNSFVDENGNVWEYYASEIDGKPVYNGMPIYAIMLNNKTGDITDDIIGLTGIDYYTELMDELY